MYEVFESALKGMAIIIVIVTAVLTIGLWEGCKCAYRHLDVKVQVK